MSSITGPASLLSNLLTGTLLSPTQAATAPAVGQGPNSGIAPSQYGSLPFTRLSLSNLGLAAPLNVGDTASILDQVSLALEITFGENENKRIESQSSARRSAWAQLTDSMKTIDTLRTENDKLKAERTGLEKQKDGKEQELATAQANYTTYDNQYVYYTGQVASLNAQIDAALADPKLAGQVPGLIAQRDAAQALADQNLADRDAEAAKISTLKDDIAALETKIADLTARIDANTAKIDAQVALMSVAATAIAADLVDSVPVKLQTDPARTMVIADLFDEITDSLRGAAMRMEAERIATALRSDSAEAQEKALKIAGALVAAVAALTDVVSTLGALLGDAPPPDAVDDGALRQGARFRIPA
ncbi:hypothetical protein [Prosthecomicrobium sp. N25]|uniref:hypothetical protein n=1 Tax=Prosthecomicrobium sp. N25 TaxID=3129254 RepID=UPI0030774166